MALVYERFWGLTGTLRASRVTSMKQVNIFHNENFPKVREGWRPGELLIHQYGYQTDRTDLEDIFRDNNAVDGTEVNVKFKRRSLSVGDVAQIDDRFYSVESIGWEEIPYEDLREWIR
jgi:hypothetical protein